MAEALAVDLTAVQAIAAQLGKIEALTHSEAEEVQTLASRLVSALRGADVGAEGQLRRVSALLDQIGQTLKLAQNGLLVVLNDTQKTETDAERGGAGAIIAGGGGASGATPNNQSPVQQFFDGLKKWARQTEQQVEDDARFLIQPLYYIADPKTGKVVTVQQDDLQQHGDMNTLYDLIDRQYGTGQPIGVTQIGSNTILVTLAGLEASQVGQANNAFDALNSGANVNTRNDPYEMDVQAAINQYLKAHNLPPGTQVVIAGHSYGGMVAQELAANSGGAQYHITNVVTFGSPQMGPHARGVNYNQYFTRYDGVPLVSWYENQTYVQQHGLIPAAQHIWDVNTGPVNVKSQFTGEQYVPVDPSHMSPDFSKWFTQDHSAYRYGFFDQTPQGNGVPFAVTQWGPTQYYSTTPQNPITGLKNDAGSLATTVAPYAARDFTQWAYQQYQRFGHPYPGPIIPLAPVSPGWP